MLALSACTPSDRTQLDEDFFSWKRYEGEPGATSFSGHAQIDRSNVAQLEIAWAYPSAGVADINPIVSDSFMYVIGEGGSIVALHAGTGEELWVHHSEVPGGVRMHGLMYWESEDRRERRVLYQKGNYWLLALDAFTGQPAAGFGDGGKVDLRPGLGLEPRLVARATSPTPGVVFEDRIILGSAPGEGYVAGPGHIRAFDIRTGQQEWIFHTLPKPGEHGYDTWPEGRSDNGGGANAWGGMSVDDERGIVYVPLGSANYDFYGIDRHGENLFANSLVALNARNGERLWHFQTVHHDLWDYDLTATPVLLTVDHEGKMTDIVVLATKTGFVFAFDRVTGEALWPIEERPVPPSEMPGEQAWPTQPFPTKPESFIPLTMSLDTDINPYLVPEDRDSLIQLTRSMQYKGMFTPPSTRPTLQVPGNRGGANWGSTAGDPRDGTFYVLSYNMPSVLHLLPIVAGNAGTGGSPFDRGQLVYQENCQICHGADLQGQPASGVPSLVGVTNRLSHDEFQSVIRNGRNMMPPWPLISTAEMELLQLFLSNPELALSSGQTVSTGEMPGSEPTRYQSGWVHILDSQGAPIIKPPWFRLTAYDMNEGTIKWQVPVGEADHLAAQGIHNTGSARWLRGGPAVTAGNLVFVNSLSKLRAYDKDTGEELWAGDLPADGEGIPAVYALNGRQYIVVSATAGAPLSQQPEFQRERVPHYVAFALPESALTQR